jgi:thiamine-phosphate pyrophosphorylase
VGTGIKTEAEQQRQNLLAVAIAASKRAEEAARALGEYLKILQPPAAIWMENLRYQLYDIEQAVLMRLRPQSRMAGVRLYVLITESFCKQPWLKTAELAIDGGANCLQLREESLTDRELLQRARQLVDLCRSRGIPCIINNRPDIALAAKADGVHLGQDDLPVHDARRIVGLERIIGISTHNLPQAHQAVADGADYIGVGPIFKSHTKPRDFLPGLEYAEAAARQIPIPAIGIAGITAENVDQVRRTGIKAIAVTAAVTASEDVAGAARQLKKLLTD